MQLALDKSDKKILMLLQQDASLSVQAIGDKIGMSQAACWRRINRLESEGFIKGRIALVDAKKAGIGTIVFAFVKLENQGRSNLDKVSKKILELPNVVECFVLMGDMDFILKIAVENLEAYQKFFLDVLSTLDGIDEIKSAMALSTIKEHSPYPIS